MSDGPRGLAVGDRFAEYLEQFRGRYPFDVELAEKHGVPAENGRFRRQMTQIRSSGSYGGSA
ncbi:hypothetical protein HAPG_00094 [Halorubrum phage GNf2]|uniref:hypothetical protein n=1 Tax=Halorubrum sp. GN12_10-3_MGM TaxID=2518113 RepID=UPI0002B7916E|nr:hypothetical protein [Halorubrum sp. GN12_10-3_MGM]AGF91279.1 hypothetical protein HAPG_00094 [Halorubrum phage GNf2]TKX64186.1 hypothetical protein EXE47_12460 [Halorubrum sp. GN12_10-3_MGM]